MKPIAGPGLTNPNVEPPYFLYQQTPLWVIRDLADQGRRSYLSAITPIADKGELIRPKANVSLRIYISAWVFGGDTR